MHVDLKCELDNICPDLMISHTLPVSFQSVVLYRHTREVYIHIWWCVA